MRKTSLYIMIVVMMAHVVVRGSPRGTAAPSQVVINTWWFTNATQNAFSVLSSGGSALDAVESGCGVCEIERCNGTVGYGGSPDENGETTLDAMIMDGTLHDVGAVGALRGVKSAISVARHVLQYTKHTLLVGSQATEFALQMGFAIENLTTDSSTELYESWQDANCQPNYWKNVFPSPEAFCGPYEPLPEGQILLKSDHKIEEYEKAEGSNDSSDSGSSMINSIVSSNTPKIFHEDYAYDNSQVLGHDTIGMVVRDAGGFLACRTSTNGASHKIPGRVGDAPIAGSGCYVSDGIGGAAATGDGDIMMRFLPSLVAVEAMRSGQMPEEAAATSLGRIILFYPEFSGAVVAMAADGQIGAACHNIDIFQYSIASDTSSGVQLVTVACSVL